jgi:hypothetical protein
VNPSPPIIPRLAGLWKLFEHTRYAVITAGMEGIPIGRDLQQVESAARALREPWDDTTLDRYQQLVDGWLDDLEKRRKK